MSSQINDLGNVWSGFRRLTLKGPVLVSHRYHPDIEQRLKFFECSVANKSVLPETTPFGIIAEIANYPRNLTESWLQVWVAEKNEDDEYEFETRCKRVYGLNEWICEATECKTVVPTGSLPDYGPTIWESEVVDFDGTHATKTTVTIVNAPIKYSDKYVKEFKQYIRISEQLVYKVTAPQASFVDGVWTHYRHVKCNWYIETKEPWGDLQDVTYGTHRNYYWPAVLTFTELAPVLGMFDDDGDGERTDEYYHHITSDFRLKEGYSGPCKAEVTISFEESATASAEVKGAMYPDAFLYSGIYINGLSVPECLHGGVTIYEVVGSKHPTLKPNQIRQKTYGGTQGRSVTTGALIPLADWSAYVVIEENDSLGPGYIKKVWTIYKPY